jgi:hypothetical protein
MGLCKKKKIVLLSFVSVLAFFGMGVWVPMGLWINGISCHGTGLWRYQL